MRLFSILLMLTLLTACASNHGRYSPKSDLYYHQIHQNTVLQRFAFQPEVERTFASTPPPLKPSENDFLTLETDLNNDGKLDVMGTIDHYKLVEDGMFPLYIMIANDYDYTLLQDAPLLTSFDLKILKTYSNGFKDFSVGGKIYKFNGEIYE